MSKYIEILSNADRSEQVDEDLKAKLKYWLDIMRIGQDIKVYTFMESLRPSVPKEIVQAIDAMISEFGPDIPDFLADKELLEVYNNYQVTDTQTCRTFWFDIAAFHTHSDLLALFPVRLEAAESPAGEGGEKAVTVKVDGEACQGA